MTKGACLGFWDAVLVLLLVARGACLLPVRQQENAKDEQALRNAISEMLVIDKVSVSHQVKPHPYMRKIYQKLDSVEAQDLGKSDGTLVQSFRSADGPFYAPPGWIWFNVSRLNPTMRSAELVLSRRTLHPGLLGVTVTLHGLLASRGNLTESPALAERALALDRRPPSGFDVFDASGALRMGEPEAVGFQLRYTDESGSLVLHEALTQGLYWLSRGSVGEPLLVLYQVHPPQIL